MLENINAFVRFPGFGPFESYTPEKTVKDGDKLQLAGLRDRRHRHARPQPGPRDVLDPGREGDLLRRRALPGLDRPHRPARLRPRDADALDRDAARHAARTTPACCPATWSRRRSATSARPTRSCASSPAGERRSRRRAARTTCCPTHADERAGSRTTAREDPRARRATAGSRRRRSRPRSCSAARVGEATDVVQKEMYTLRGRQRRQPDAAPRGHRAGRPRLPRARHAQGAAAGEALVPLELLPLRDARRPAASASSGRSARRPSARADPAVDAELILLLARAAGGDRRARRASSCSPRSASPTSAPPTARSSRRTCGRNEDQLSRGGRRPDRPQPAARVRRQARAHAAGDGQRAAADRPPAAGGPRPLRRGPGPARSAAGPRRTTVDTTLVRGLDYYTRTLFEFQSGALEAAQNTLGGGGRYDGLAERSAARRRPAWAGRPGSSGCSWRPRSRSPSSRRSTSTSPTSPGTRRRRSGWPPTPAAPATRQDSNSPGAALKGQLKQASRTRARYVAIFGDEGVQLRDRDGGEDKLVAPETVMHHIRGPL